MNKPYGFMTMDEIGKSLIADFVRVDLNKTIEDKDFDDILVSVTEDGRKVFTGRVNIDNELYICEVTGPWGASWRHTVTLSKPVMMDHVSFSDEDWLGVYEIM